MFKWLQDSLSNAFLWSVTWLICVYSNCTLLLLHLQVYAVPLGNITVPSNPPRTEIKTTLMCKHMAHIHTYTHKNFNTLHWLTMPCSLSCSVYMHTDPNLTEVRNITLSVTVAERDHSSGTVTLQGHLYIPPSVLVNIATLRPDLTLKLTNDDGEVVPSSFSPNVYRSIEVCILAPSCAVSCALVYCT